MRHLLSKYVLAVVAVTVALAGILLLALLAEQTSVTSAVLDGRRQLLIEQRRDRIIASCSGSVDSRSTRTVAG